MPRKLTFLAVLILFNSFASAQIKSTFYSIKPDLEKVINDYPNHFTSIKGEKTNSSAGTIEYLSTIQIKGADETKVIGYPAEKKTHWVWEARLLVTEDLNALRRQYKSYYNDIAGKSMFSKGSNNSIEATGPYRAPSEELRTWSNQFRVNDVTGEYSRLVIDLVAEYVNFEWVIFLRIYDKEKDEDMRPTKDTNDPWRYGNNKNGSGE